MGYFFRCLKSTFNLENSKCICQENVFVYHVTGSTYSIDLLFLSYAYLKAIHKTLKGTGKIQFVLELIISLNLQISTFHSSLHKEKIKIIKAWILLFVWESLA